MLNLKKSLLAGSAVLAMGISTASIAAYGLPEAPAPVYNWYVGGFGGLTYTPDQSGFTFNNPNWDIGAHIGYRWDPVRIELEYVYQRSQIDDSEATIILRPGFREVKLDVQGHFNINAAMANVLYDINIDSSITPYIGFGIGYAGVDLTSKVTFTGPFGTEEIKLSSPCDGRFAYQALAGIGFKVMDNAMVNIGYRYFGTTSGDFDENWQNHLFNVGFDYYFL